VKSGNETGELVVFGCLVFDILALVYLFYNGASSKEKDIIQ
jgi:hypothetical protein